VARRLNKMGFRAAALKGGYDAWREAYPVEPVGTGKAAG
jgi:rhodanese-related sulfurtransferase